MEVVPRVPTYFRMPCILYLVSCILYLDEWLGGLKPQVSGLKPSNHRPPETMVADARLRVQLTRWPWQSDSAAP